MSLQSARAGRTSFAQVAQAVLSPKLLLPAALFLVVGYVLPWLALVYLACGLYDVSRNRKLDLTTLRLYFFGNDILLWLLSPLNALFDLLALPHINKGAYRLEDLPPDYRDEVKRLIEIAERENLVARLEERSKAHPRAMVFWKWYGVDVDTFVDIPAFHQRWKHVRTIGVSIFRRKVSTAKHFGYLRATLRVLYNLNDLHDHSAYIVVGDQTSYWRDNKLFIFDDTLLHQSFNETEQTRHCMFVDIVRPSPFPRLMGAVVTLVGLVCRGVYPRFYHPWTVLGR
jgi:aspartyl/asparaginyl beta-hydroxylase (cupin superfamily)